MSPPAPVLKYHTVIRQSWPRCHLDYCAVRGNCRAVVDSWHIVYEEDETWNKRCHSEESHLELRTTEILTLECLNWARMLWCNCVSGKLPKLWRTALYLQLIEEICVEDYTSGCRMKPPNLFPELQKLDFVFFCRLLRGNKFGVGLRWQLDASHYYLLQPGGSQQEGIPPSPSSNYRTTTIVVILKKS